MSESSIYFFMFLDGIKFIELLNNKLTDSQPIIVGGLFISNVKKLSFTIEHFGRPVIHSLLL